LENSIGATKKSPPLKKHPVSEGGPKLDGKRGKLALGFGSTEAYLGAEETI